MILPLEQKDNVNDLIVSTEDIDDMVKLISKTFVNYDEPGDYETLVISPEGGGMILHVERYEDYSSATSGHERVLQAVKDGTLKWRSPSGE